MDGVSLLGSAVRSRDDAVVDRIIDIMGKEVGTSPALEVVPVGWDDAPEIAVAFPEYLTQLGAMRYLARLC